MRRTVAAKRVAAKNLAHVVIHHDSKDDGNDSPSRSTVRTLYMARQSKQFVLVEPNGRDGSNVAEGIRSTFQPHYLLRPG
jgi:hypothetical protein